MSDLKKNTHQIAITLRDGGELGAPIFDHHNDTEFLRAKGIEILDGNQKETSICIPMRHVSWFVVQEL